MRYPSGHMPLTGLPLLWRFKKKNSAGREGPEPAGSGDTDTAGDAAADKGAPKRRR